MPWRRHSIMSYNCSLIFMQTSNAGSGLDWDWIRFNLIFLCNVKRMLSVATTQYLLPEERQSWEKIAIHKFYFLGQTTSFKTKLSESRFVETFKQVQWKVLALEPDRSGMAMPGWDFVIHLCKHLFQGMQKVCYIRQTDYRNISCDLKGKAYSKDHQ